MELSGDPVITLCGLIVTSGEPGGVMKFWRRQMNLKQTLLAKEMGITASVLSDYESGRRSSPGIKFVRKYVEGLVKLDEEHNKLLGRGNEMSNRSAFIGMGEFGSPVPAKKIVEMVSGKVLTGKSLLGSSIHGYTILDSIKAIYTLSGSDFYSVFGQTSERVLIFTKVGLGRSPLIAIRVSQLKPRMVILHGPSTVDQLALDLASREKMVLVLSEHTPEHELLEIFQKIKQ
ncbi:MAG: helix-turn-helix domain-containing protein [Thaumarchaeota archaeon]|nr:helix-turn-helix domain-containing protein [Nitrososphaerota archaeon]